MSVASMYYDQIIDIIRAFNALYPEAEYGFAHLVLSDYNILDHDIEFCLAEFQKIDSPSTSDVVTHQFLLFLKSLPESWREEPED